MTDWNKKELDIDENLGEKDKSREKQKHVIISTSFTKTMDEIAHESVVLQEKSLELKKMLLQEYYNFEFLKQNVAREREIMKKRIMEKNDEIIELNIGGQPFTTFKSTLMKPKDGMLAAMFGGNFVPGIKDRNGRWFLDRPPKPFEIILNCLRTDSKLILPEDEVDQKIFMEEINFYGLQEYFIKDLGEETIVGGSFLPKCSLLKVGEQKQLLKWIEAKGKWKLLYKASKDGFGASRFRFICGNKGPTMTIIKSTMGSIFGGYNATSWTTSNTYTFNNGCFLFKCGGNGQSNEMVKLDNTGLYHGNMYSTYNGSTYGPTWGGGHDLHICDSSNTSNTSYTNLGHSFACPPGNQYGSTQAQSYLAGSYNFTVAEIEVYCQ